MASKPATFPSASLSLCAHSIRRDCGTEVGRGGEREGEERRGREKREGEEGEVGRGREKREGRRGRGGEGGRRGRGGEGGEEREDESMMGYNRLIINIH